MMESLEESLESVLSLMILEYDGRFCAMNPYSMR